MPNPAFESTISENRKKEKNILSAMYVYFKKTYKRMYFYKYKLGTFTGRYKKAKFCDELIKIKDSYNKSALQKILQF